MSNLVHKVKDALSSDKSSSHTSSTTPHQTTHASNHPQENQRVGQEGAGFSQPQTEGFATTGVNPNRGVDGPATTTDGPHKNNLLNKADPRVDSDGDRSKNLGMNPQGTATTDNRRTEGTNLTGSGTGGTHVHNTRSSGQGGENLSSTGATGTTGQYGTHERSGGVPEGTFGHHNSRVANAADPRIDSDLDSRRNAGATGAVGDATTSTGTHRHGGVTGENLGSTGRHGTTGGFTEGTQAGYGNEGFSSTTGASTTTHGRSGLTGQGDNVGRTGYGEPGPAPNTAGPHKSDMLNKADPRVDSNLDGSKTYGGDKTFDQGNSTANKDPRDATQVPPSVMQKHIGKPAVEH